MRRANPSLTQFYLNESKNDAHLIKNVNDPNNSNPKLLEVKKEIENNVIQKKIDTILKNDDGSKNLGVLVAILLFAIYGFITLFRKLFVVK